MRNYRWIAVLVGLMACGLIAAGCGGGDASTTTPAATSETTSTEATPTTTDDSTSTTSTDDSTTSSDTGAVDASAFYDACINAAQGNAAATTVCGQARDSLEKCSQQAQASGDDDIAATAIKACQDIADKAVEQLNAATP